MKKKKTMASSAASDAAVPTPPKPDLKTLIRDHSVFFDRLVDLIPARFYLPLDDEDRPWYQGLSKAAKASVKIQSRENLKKARRARLDPDAPPSSTLDLLSKSLAAAAAAASSDSDPNPNPSSDEGDDKEDDDDDDDDDDEEEEEEEEEKKKEAEAQRATETMDDRSATDVGLRQRLQARIAELRSARNTRPETINKPKKEKKKKNKSKKEKKINKEEEGGAPSSPLGKRKRDEEESNAVPTDISFGKVRSGGEDDQNKGKKKKKKKKKLSKQQELERARQLEEAKKDPEKGDKFARKHSWKAAASRAAGEKVHDDPKLLKESIKREERSRKKHAEKWKERMDTVEKARAEKQKTRADNIRGRAEQKRMRRIEKREKKLMRPGFEGRKEGYING